MNTGRQFLHLAAAAVILVGLSGRGGWSQATRTTKIIVPVSPGGVLDTLARLLSEQIRHAQGQTMLVENRSGAGGMIAAEAVSRAAPDGNTLMMVSPDFLATSYLRKLDYELRFEPVCYLTSVPNVIVVNSASFYWNPCRFT
jgi:tripartite-type tricarboxylate transporter receptor subunit TctC